MHRYIVIQMVCVKNTIFSPVECTGSNLDGGG